MKFSEAVCFIIISMLYIFMALLLVALEIGAVIFAIYLLAEHPIILTAVLAAVLGYWVGVHQE